MNRYILSVSARRTRRAAVRGALAALLISGALVLSPSDATGQPLLDEEAALAGIRGVYVMGGEVSGLETHSSLLREDVLGRVEARLDASGVPVFDEREWLKEDSAPVLHMDIKAQGDIFMVTLDVLVLVHPVSTPDETAYAVIWSRARAGMVGPDVSASINEALDSISDTFSTAFARTQ